MEEIFEKYKDIKREDEHITRDGLRMMDRKFLYTILKRFKSYSEFKRLFDEWMQSQTTAGDNRVDVISVELEKEIYKKNQIIKILTSKNKELMSQICLKEDISDTIKQFTPIIELKTPKKDCVKLEDIDAGTAILHLSDIHYGEVVDMNGVMYNCEIAEKRIKNIFEQFREFVGYADNMIIFANGDLINGSIHPEFSRTNEKTSIEAVLDLSNILVSEIVDLYNNTHSHITIAFTVGNHARVLPGDVYYKKQVKENWEYMLGNIIKQQLSSYNDIEVVVSETPSSIWEIEGLRFAVTHGDIFKSLNNIRVNAAKFVEMNMTTSDKLDCLLIGHFHTTRVEDILGGKIYVNGSVKGVDEYSIAHNLSISKPSQTAFWVREKQIKYLKFIEPTI